MTTAEERPRALAGFDRYLTDLVAGLPPAPVDDVDPTLIATARRVARYDTTPAPDPVFADRLWADLMRASAPEGVAGLAAVAPAGSAPTAPDGGRGSAIPRPDAPWRRSGGRWRGGAVSDALFGPRAVSAVATALLLIVTVAAVLYVLAPPDDDATGGGATDHLYLAGQNGRSFRAIDPRTLADLPGTVIPAPVADAAADHSTAWIASADGSTLVRIDVEPPSSSAYGRARFTVYDAGTGRERSRFEAAEWAQVDPLLSADGQTLVLESPAQVAHQSNGTLVLGRPAAWSVFATATGGLVTTIEATEPAAAGLLRTGYLDSGGTRLYRIATRGRQDTVGPWPSDLIIHDLPSGRETGRIALDGVLSGFWWTGQSADVPLIPGAVAYQDEYLVPSIAATPDGATLMILEGDASAVTVVDVGAGTTRRVPIDPTVLRRVLVRPADGASRYLEYATRPSSVGSDAQALSAPDAGRLLFGGLRRERHSAEAGAVWVEDLGLQLVALTGEATVVGAAPYSLGAFGGPRSVVPSGDGRAYFVTGFPVDAPAGNRDRAFHLARLAAGTLAVEAERDIATLGPPVFLAEPLPPNGPG